MSAGKIRPLNDENSQWAKGQPNESVDFFIKQFEVNPVSNFRFCVTRIPYSGGDLTERITSFNEFNEFAKSVFPDKDVFREYFVPEVNKDGFIDVFLTIDMIRLFEVFAKYPHEKPENVCKLNQSLPELYSAEKKESNGSS